MKITSNLPRAELFKHQESSSLSTPRERNSLLHTWKSQREDASRSMKQNQLLSQMRTEVSRLGNQQKVGNGLFPFKIYNFPRSLRSFKNDNDWQRFKVRDGFITIGSDEGFENPVLGSDASTQFGQSPYSDQYLTSEIPPTNSSNIVAIDWHEAIVPADDNTYYFWVSCCIPQDGVSLATSPIGILFGSSKVGATVLQTGGTCTDPWPSFPFNDPYHQLIGSVTIPTSSDPPIAYQNIPLIVQQFEGEVMRFPKADNKSVSGGTIYSPFHGSRMDFQGTYDSNKYYFTGDVVQTTTTTSGFKWLNNYVFMATSSGTYDPFIVGPTKGINPDSNNPDPWILLSKSPIDVDYHNDASYQAAKYYLRTA